MSKFVTGLILGAGSAIAGVCLYAVGYTDGKEKGVEECTSVMEILRDIYKGVTEPNEEEEEA